MTIGGALSDLNNLLNADNIPVYYKPSIKAVMDTIISEYQKMGHWKAYTHSAYPSDMPCLACDVCKSFEAAMEKVKENDNE